MDGFAQEALARLPLAEAVLRVWEWVAQEEQLRDLFDRHRGRCYERVVSFPVMVHLVADALLEHGGSGRQSFERGIENGELDASIQAAYGKLSRLPIPLSMGFLADCTERLRVLFPEGAIASLPGSLSDFHVIVLDGKAIQRVAKRLKPLRGVSGGVLGGRALVAMSLEVGLAIAMHAHPDGDANDVRFVPELLPQVRRRVSGPRLWLADRQFCDLEQTQRFSEQEDHFLVRYAARVRFHPDPQRPARNGRDAAGRPYVEAWGWLGKPGEPRRRHVRQITLKRPGEEDVILVTDLLDAARYPASDLLALYLARWGIERMFQQVTEVFGLQALIGGSPEATIFQLAFCLVLYNIIQVVRAYVAEAQRRPPETISTEKLFIDVERELTGWSVLVPPEATIACLHRPTTAKALRARLRRLLGSVWTPRWIKAPPKKRRAPPPSSGFSRSHTSVYRVLRAHSDRHRRVQK